MPNAGDHEKAHVNCKQLAAVREQDHNAAGKGGLARDKASPFQVCRKMREMITAAMGVMRRHTVSCPGHPRP